MIRNVPELRRTMSLLATTCAAQNYVERYSRPANLDSVTAYVLHFCRNSHYPNDRKIGIGIPESIICLHLYGGGSSL